MCKISDDPLKLISSVLEVNIMLYNGEREKKRFFSIGPMGGPPRTNLFLLFKRLITIG